MKAYVNYSFKKSFILGEEGIRKISEIIRTRVPDQELEFTIYRSDNLVYKTLSIEDILKEENSTRNQIEKIEIKVEVDGISIGIEFCKKEGVTIDIKSEDRDKAFLLASDLKEYIRTEIISRRSISIKRSFIKEMIFPFGMLWVLGASMVLSFKDYPKFSEDEIEGVLASTNVDEKLNVILQYTHSSKDMSELPWIITVVAVSMLLLFSVGPAVSKLYPRNIFYVGKEITRYDGIVVLRSKILWGVIVSFIVSSLAGALLYISTK